jgi:hypothetical protein
MRHDPVRLGLDTLNQIILCAGNVRSCPVVNNLPKSRNVASLQKSSSVQVINVDLFPETAGNPDGNKMISPIGQAQNA